VSRAVEELLPGCRTCTGRTPERRPVMLSWAMR
jgi:hypothetical protein